MYAWLVWVRRILMSSVAMHGRDGLSRSSPCCLYTSCIRLSLGLASPFHNLIYFVLRSLLDEPRPCDQISCVIISRRDTLNGSRRQRKKGGKMLDLWLVWGNKPCSKIDMRNKTWWVYIWVMNGVHERTAWWHNQLSLSEGNFQLRVLSDICLRTPLIFHPSRCFSHTPSHVEGPREFPGSLSPRCCFVWMSHDPWWTWCTCKCIGQCLYDDGPSHMMTDLPICFIYSWDNAAAQSIDICARP